jgi:hypothetical protein
MARRAAALVSVAVLLGALVPASALAQSPSNPLSPVLPELSTPTSTPTTTVAPVQTTSTTGSGLTSADAFVIAIGAGGLLIGISFFIWRDARRRAPTRGHNVTTAGTTSRAATKKPPPKSRKPSPAERRRRKRGRAR